MAVLLNAAGVSAADPILKGLSFEWLIGAASMDVAAFTDAFIDPATGAGVNSVRASVSPSANTIISGTSGVYTQTGTTLTVGSTTGLTAGDYIYLSHGSITAGLYLIGSITNGTTIVLGSDNPFIANQTAVSFQVSWKYNGVAGTAPSVSSVGGSQNYLKATLTDGANPTTLVENHFVRDALTGSAYIAIGGQNFTGATTAALPQTLSLLSSWANKGGISHVALAVHSVQAVNNFTFGDATTTEKTRAAAETSGLALTGADGIKYGRVLLRSKAGGAAVGVDISMTLDTVGPNIVFSLRGR